MLELIQRRDNRIIYKGLLFCVLLLIISGTMNAQTEKKYIREGNREFEKNKFSESEISYRKAIDKNKQSPDAVFNIGDALYKQNKFDEAGKQFIENTNQSADKIKKSSGFYNLGNSLLKAKKFQESIDAYENSLKLRPDNNEAKYNLAYAQDLLKQQQQQQQQQQNNNKDKQNQKKDKNKNDQNKDQNNQKEEQQKDNKNNQDQKQQQEKQQQPQQQEISRDDAQRLLNSLENDEKKVQEKVELARAAKSKVRAVKNW